MADTTGPVYQLIIQGTIFDQVIENVFWYNVEAGTGFDADELGVAFREAVLSFIIGIQSTAVEWLTLFVLGARDSTDVATIDVTGTNGLITGDCLPPYAAWSYIYTRKSRAMRHGFKRFAGVPESWQTNGEVATGTPTTTVGDLGSSLQVILELGADVTGAPVVPQRQRHGVPLTPIEYWSPADINFHGITTQNSRKFGR